MATFAVVMQPTTPAAAEVDVYTTPGRHFVNGREWDTTCGKYSSTVNRCRTEILATLVTYEGGRYVQKTAFVFNNLTYLPAPRKDYVGNPIGETGTWTSVDGRQWRTECDTPTTGRDGCRSYIYATYIGVVKENPRTYGQMNGWLFNNIVRFSPPPKPPTPPVDPCLNLPIPTGFEVSIVNGKKMPHATKTPYEPNTLYNPTSISQFIRAVLRNTSLKQTDRAKWDCLVDLGTTALMDGSTTKKYAGKTVRWFPYMFEFDASGSPEEIPPLAPGWISGMAQGSNLGLMAELATATGNNKWLKVGDETLNSFRVPLSEGGFRNSGEDDLGVPWFEMYPTSPPTRVLNGQLEALTGLDIWARDGRGTDTQFARDLFNEAVPVLQGDLPKFEVDVQGGTLTSYDGMRGYAADPLRLTQTEDGDFNLEAAQLNGVDVTAALPITSPTPAGETNMLGTTMVVGQSGKVKGEWRTIATKDSTVTESNGTATIRSAKTSWQGIQQIVDSTEFTASEPLTMTVDANLTLTDQPKPLAGLSGRVAVYQQCGSNVSLLFETQKPRGRDWSTYTMDFTAPPVGCDIWVQLLTSGYGLTGTTVQYKNIELRKADPVDGALFTDDVEGFDDLSILDTPTVELSLTGTGTAQLEVHSDGTWQKIDDVTLTPGAVTTLEVPERYTGRNLHYGYHENNVGLLGSLYQRAYAAGYPLDDITFLRDYAVRWELMAPSRHGTVPGPITVNPQARMAQQGPDLDSYELPLVDPFQLFMEE